jgi:hypothetical protein
VRLRAGRLELDAKLLLELDELVRDADLLGSLVPAREPEVARALLDVAGAFLEAPDARTGERAPATLRDSALGALTRRVDASFARWLASDVAARPSEPLERRTAAVRLLAGQTQPFVLEVLLGCAAERAWPLRREALASLAGWHDEAVHAVFLRELQRELAGQPAAAGYLAERHFTQVSAAADGRLLQGLAPIVQEGLVARDWRAASRAVALSRPFPHEAVVPRLIESMRLWQARGPTHGHALRLQLEIERELRVRSGRSFGLDAETWRRWWVAVRRGELPASGGGAGAGPAPASGASFFGLRPQSDRIVFVIDRSGSMEMPFAGPGTGAGAPAAARWDRAIERLFEFLEALGAESRFDLVLFHDYAQAWRKGELMRADEAGLRAAREWLATQHPGGATALRMGIEAALGIGRDGRMDLERLQADTVVVLCDGDTDEGPAWVGRFLEQVNSQARVVFHGVQVGGAGDGTLDALANGTGGQFVRVGG